MFVNTNIVFHICKFSFVCCRRVTNIETNDYPCYLFWSSQGFYRECIILYLRWSLCLHRLINGEFYCDIKVLHRCYCCFKCQNTIKQTLSPLRGFLPYSCLSSKKSYKKDKLTQISNKCSHIKSKNETQWKRSKCLPTCFDKST